MTESEALDILGCDEKTELDDVYETLIFDFRSKFLQVIPPIKVMDSIIKKIDRVNKAYCVFYDIEKPKQSNFKNINKYLDLGEYCAEYQARLSSIRINIVNQFNGFILVNQINKLIKLQSELYLKLSQYIDWIEVEVLNEFEIKLSQSIDIYKIQLELKEIQLDENKISEYIRNQINELDIENMTELSLSVLNSVKQVNFNGIRREI